VDSQLRIVVAQLGQDLLGAYPVAVIICDTLQPGDLPDRMQSDPAELPNALRDTIGGREYLITLLVQQQVGNRESVAPSHASENFSSLYRGQASP
jgi:hypothetical protein